MDLYAVCFTIYLKKGYFCFDRKSILLLQGNHYHTIRLAEDEDWTFYLFNSSEDYEKGGKNHLVNFKSLVLIKILYNSKFI